MHSYIRPYIHAYIHTYIHTYTRTHTRTQEEDKRDVTLVVDEDEDDDDGGGGDSAFDTSASLAVLDELHHIMMRWGGRLTLLALKG